MMKRLSIAGAAISVVCLVLVGIANGAVVVYEEDFEDGVADNITQYFGGYPYLISEGLGDSTYGLASDDRELGTGLIFGIDGVKSDNIRVEADFQVRNGTYGDFSVGLNVTGFDSSHPKGQTGYWVNVSPIGADTPDYIFEHNGGTGEFLVLEPAFSGKFLANEEHRLTVDRLNGSINTFIDGVPYMSASDTTWSGGGIFFQFFGPGTIDNIRVTDLSPVPEPASLAVWSLLCLVGFVIVRRRRHA